MSRFWVLFCVWNIGLVAGCASETWPGGIQARLMWSQARGARVVDLPEKGSAAKAGLRVGDRLIAIDGVPVGDLDPRQIHELLGGEVGTWVRITVERDGQWQTFRIERTPYRARGP